MGPVITLEVENNGLEKHAWTFGLIVRVEADEIIEPFRVYKSMKADWEGVSHFDVLAIDANLVSFSFERMVDRNWVLDRSPWHVADFLLSLQP